MLSNAFVDDFDEWDCLYCKKFKTCPFGRAVIEGNRFSRLAESCPVKIAFEWDTAASPEIRDALTKHYGIDPMADTQEFQVFTRVHGS